MLRPQMVTCDKRVHAAAHTHRKLIYNIFSNLKICFRHFVRIDIYICTQTPPHSYDVRVSAPTTVTIYNMIESHTFAFYHCSTKLLLCVCVLHIFVPLSWAIQPCEVRTNEQWNAHTKIICFTSFKSLIQI